MAYITARFPSAQKIELYSGGPYSISGTTANKDLPSNLPAYRRVRLHDQPTGRALREVWSDETTGAYSFDNIRAGTFFILSFDHTGTYGAVIADGIVVPAP